MIGTLSEALARHGMRLRGTLEVQSSDAPRLQLPPFPHGNGAAVLCLVGVVGSEFWPHFKASHFYADGLPDPLDRWSRHIGDALAHEHQGLVLYPFDGPPWHPFQQWADLCEPTQPSPLMLRIHPEYGLWHAYRFALLLAADTTGTSISTKAESLCANCATQACLHTCPVQAYTGTAFMLNACANHLRSPQGGLCMEHGCQARLACPLGTEFRYNHEHAAFHMQAFLQARPFVES